MLQYIVAMRIIPSLLRLLLVASLLLNGLGLPMQAHGSDLQHSQASIELPGVHGPSHDESSEQRPCHGEGAVLVGSLALAVAVEPPPQDAQPDPGSLDCCDKGNCDGVCMQSTSALLTGKVFDPAIFPLAADARSNSAGTPTPALPHPIRPPIG